MAMRYLLPLLFLAGCSKGPQPNYETSYVDVTTLNECTSQETSSKTYVHFEADNGDVLFVATKGKDMCLKRKIKPRISHKPCRGSTCVR